MVREYLSKAIKTLILEEPFYGLFIVGLNKTYRTDIPTAGVSQNGIGVQLVVNPEYLENLNEDQRKGLLKHEVLHISFGHLLTRNLYSDKQLFNIAADIEINQYITERCLPEGGLTLNSFPELNLPAKAGTDKYYELLQQAKKDNTSPSLDNLLGQMDGNSQYCHNTWDEFDNLPESEKKLIKKQVEHQIKEVAQQTEKRRGNIPGELAELIRKLLNITPPKFNWKAYLKRFVGNSSVIYTKKLRRKYNKRYSENPGLKIKTKNHVCVGVDTSGSVSTNELIEFMNEINHMHKTGHKITVVQCDTQITSIEDFNPKKDWGIKGRGGTDFQPVIDHYNQSNYTALIYLTDGEAYTPQNCPKNALWVHSSQCRINEELPGLKIQLN
tara:strand:- start:13812 stop:14963 length:1152 start_codon:yes stop_codon:yes gene_type:complete